jgi:predicted permease
MKRGRPHLWLISLVSRLVPRRFRSEWKQEWEAELVHRESQLSRASRSQAKIRRDLMWRSIASLYDAIAMQPRRLEEEMMQDLRYGIRLLFQHKAVTAVAILSLAVGIGANTALFSLVDAMLLKNLPVHNPEELVLFNWSAPQNSANDVPLNITYDGNWTDPVTGRTTWDSFSYQAFQEFKANAETLSAVFAFARIYRANIVAGRSAELGDGQLVSGGYFGALGVNSVVGRLIEDSDDRAAAAPVVVLGYQYWRRRFALDPDIVGQTLRVNNVALTVVGVTPPQFSGTLQVEDSPDIYVPMAAEPLLVSPQGHSPLKNPDHFWLQIMGRLKTGASPEQVRGSMDAVYQHTVHEMPGNASGGFSPVLEVVSGEQGLQSSRQRYSRPLTILILIIGLVLLVACANVANLLLSRAASRRREIATRMSIGATRQRLVRQLLTESMLLAAIGGVVGAVLAYWGKDLLLRWGPWSVLPEQMNVAIDLRVLSFAVLVTAITGLLFGLAPALRSIRFGISATLVQNARTLSAVRSRLAKSLLVAQVAMSLVLFTGAAFFVQTLWKLRHIDVGFNAANLLLVRIDPSLNGYQPAKFIDTVEQIVERFGKITGVQAATVSNQGLVGDGGNYGSRVRAEMPSAILSVRSNFFETVGVPLTLGRTFTTREDLTAPNVAMVNETFVRRNFPDANPLGKRVWDLEIVGVVRDTKVRSLRAAIPPAVFLPYALDGPRRVTFQLRVAGNPSAFVPQIREVVRQVDPDLPVFDIQTLEDRITRTQLNQEKLFANFASAFGGVALFLVCVGLYGTTSYNVARRTHEIGIRVALGAGRSKVRAMVMREALFLVSIGVVLGLAGAVALTRRIESMLFGLTSHDPMTLAVATFVMVGIGTVAAYLPARRAFRIQPMAALRHE